MITRRWDGHLASIRSWLESLTWGDRMPKAEIMQRAGLGAAQFELFRSPLRHYMEREFDKQLIAVPGDSAKTKPAVNNLLPGERVDFRKVRP